MNRRTDGPQARHGTTRRAAIRLLLGVLVVALPLLAAARPVAADLAPLDAPRVTSVSVFVQDASANVPLMEKNADERRSPSSTVKIVVAQVVVDNAELDEQVVVDQADVATGEESQMFLVAGDTLTVQQLLEGALIPSGNDAARTLARFVGAKLLGGDRGDPIARFVDEMNAYAESLELENTRFVNADGLDDDDQYSSARDLATLAAQIMRNRVISAIVRESALAVTSIGPEARTYQAQPNSNRLIEGGTDAMEEVHGVKTGTTPDAGANLIVAKWSPGGNRIVAVVMGSDVAYGDDGFQVEGSDKRYDDMRSILGEVERSWAWLDPAEEEQMPGLGDELAAWQVQLRNGSAIVIPAESDEPISYQLELQAPAGDSRDAGRVLFFAGSELLAERSLTFT